MNFQRPKVLKSVSQILHMIGGVGPLHASAPTNLATVNSEYNRSVFSTYVRTVTSLHEHEAA